MTLKQEYINRKIQIKSWWSDITSKQRPFNSGRRMMDQFDNSSALKQKIKKRCNKDSV